MRKTNYTMKYRTESDKYLNGIKWRRSIHSSGYYECYEGKGFMTTNPPASTQVIVELK